VDLSDGTFSTTKIFAVSGLPEEIIGHGNGATKKPIGNFYVQFAGSLAAYDLPGGALTMVFVDQSNFGSAQESGKVRILRGFPEIRTLVFQATQR
jgi:hypothetical protein